MPVDGRFAWQRAQLLAWYASPGHEGRWWRKDQLPVHISRNQESLARRSRELVELGYLQQRMTGGVAYYRFPTDGQRAIRQEPLL